MKQAQSLIEMKNKENKFFTEIVSGQNSDTDVPYTSLVNNAHALENNFNNEGT